MSMHQHGGRNFRQITALAIATTFLTQNFAWAICSDGTSFPPGNGGFNLNTLTNVAPSLANMSPNIFTASAGSVYIPDNSSFENNDPTNVSTVALNGSGITGLPVAAVGGHNWVMDQGSTTCKETSTSSGSPPIAIIPGQAPAGWAIPPNTTTDCFVLPVVKFQTVTVTTNLNNGQVKSVTSTGSACNGIPGTTTVNNIITSITCSVTFANFGVVPLTSQAIVTPCDPTLLPTAPLTPVPGNTRLNQLGCSISQLDTGVITARDQTIAPAYMATASIMGGLFMQRLDNVNPPDAIGDSGRQISSLIYFADTAGIPAGTKLTNAIVSPDGHFVMATSIRRDARVFGCNMPLGDPGRIDSPPVSLAQFALSTDTIGTPTSGVKCMSNIGTTGLSVTLSNVWGADNQPYLGGQRTITTPGTTGNSPGSALSPSAWPQCIAQNKGETFTLPAVYPPLATNLGQTDAQAFQAVATLDAAIADVFRRHLGGNCLWGPNSGFSASPVIQPNTLATYTASNGNMYMFTAGTGQPIVQTRMSFDAIGQTHYTTRTYFSNGNGFATGVGIAPDMNFTTPGSVTTAGAPTPAAGATGSGSVIVMTDPTGLGLAGQEVMSRLPLCEDF
jgi:hypothetical protein